MNCVNWFRIVHESFQYEEDGSVFYWFSFHQLAVCVNVQEKAAEELAAQMIETLKIAP